MKVKKVLNKLLCDNVYLVNKATGQKDYISCMLGYVKVASNDVLKGAYLASSGIYYIPVDIWEAKVKEINMTNKYELTIIYE